MNIVIDELNSNTGFTASGTASIIVPENGIEDFIAGPDNSASVQFQFRQNGDYVEKTGLNIDVSNYQYAVCHFYSSFNKLTTGKFTLMLDDTHTFDIDTFPYLEDNYFRLDEINTITKIRITYTGNELDRLMCSHCLAVVDELPVDIFLSTQKLIEKEIFRRIGKGYLLGTVTANIGEEGIALNQISYNALQYIDRYAVIEIDDGTNSEKHVLEENDENYFSFGKLIDGETIQNNYTNANVYLIIPVRYGVKQLEYNTPSIAITGFAPVPVLRGGKIETVLTTREPGTVYTRFNNQIQQHQIQVTCIDRFESELMAFMSQVIRDVIARETLWINGQRYDTYYEGQPEFIAFEEADNPISGLTYTMQLEIKEEIWPNVKLPRTISQNLTVQIQNP